MDVARFLSGVDAFRTLPPPVVARLAAHSQIVDHPQGATILRQGDAADRMYVIVAGTVEIPIRDDRGGRTFVASLGPGQYFGEMALLTGEPRSANVLAATDCRCVALPRAAVHELIGQHSAVAAFLTAILGQRLLEAGGIRRVGKYRLTGELGRGGMSIVYEGVHPTLDRIVAVKMLAHALVHDADFAEGFRKEARVIASLRHPNIVEVFDTEEAYATLFIIMEKLHGVDIAHQLRDGRLPTHDAVRSMIVQAASALGHAHDRGIVHRDIKPSNICLTSDGIVKLMDFGLALAYRRETATTSDGSVVGTPAYMSPEQATAQPVDGRSDLYSLGIVVFEMLTGRVPYPGDDAVAVMTQHVNGTVPRPGSVTAGIPRDLDAFVQRATARDPADRYQTCAEVLAHFGHTQRSTSGAHRRRTVTLIYEPEREKAVEALIEALRHRAAATVPGLLVE